MTTKKTAIFIKQRKSTWLDHTPEKQKKWRSLFVIPEKLAEKVHKSRQQDFATKVR